MNEQDKIFKKTALDIGTSLLIFIVLYQTLYASCYMYFRIILYHIIPSETIANIITEILSGVLYLSVFLIPAAVFSLLKRRHGKKQLMTPKPKCSPKTAVLIVLASIGIITAAAYVNTIIASFFNVPGNIIPLEKQITLVDFLLNTFTLAIVPAFCEEFLFRKTILSALSPYGEVFAIISSSILFGLMHQNVLQIFYATMAGIVIGYAYSRTRSFLCVFLIHFSNNFVSVIKQLIGANFTEKWANIIGTTVTFTVLALGLISVLTLIIKELYKKSVYTEGAFERIDIPSPNYVKYKLASNPTKSFFLSPTVLIFTIICLGLCFYMIFP